MADINPLVLAAQVVQTLTEEELAEFKNLIEHDQDRLFRMLAVDERENYLDADFFGQGPGTRPRPGTCAMCGRAR